MPDPRFRPYGWASLTHYLTPAVTNEIDIEKRDRAAMDEKTIEGLALVVLITPYRHSSGGLIELVGEWTQTMIADHGDWELEPGPAGIHVWEGKATRKRNGDEVTYEFSGGGWRALREEEAVRLASGLMPLSALPFQMGGETITPAETID